MSIEIPDYCIEGRFYDWENELRNLLPIANKELKDLNPNLLIFPNVLGKHYNDGLDEKGKTICTIYPSEVDENGKLRGIIKTWDIMGFVGCKDTELTIHSRFAKNDKNDFFLHYMVQRVFNINLFDLQHSSAQEKVLDFLICLFPNCLKEALSQGMYKQYMVNCYNDSKVRGMIDVARHIKLNIPFAGKIAYNVREYSFDNNITQLIRHTIEYIRTTHMSRVLKIDNDTEGYISQICVATPSYKMHDRGKIISKNLKSPTHPYYNKYINLQKLCIKILTHNKLKYGKDNNEIYGLLFSGSWLWEEYLYKAVLKDCSFKHPKNKVREGGISLFTDGRYQRYPDYYKEDFVLDAKYKRIESKDEIDNDDMHQVISYMHILEATKGGLIHPCKYDEKKSIQEFNPKEDVGILKGYGGFVYLIRVPILDYAKDYYEFQKTMKNIECELKDKIMIDIKKTKVRY